MNLTLITPPADEPLDLQEAKDHLHVAGTVDDGYIDALIVAARRQCEQATGRQLVTQTWDVAFDAFTAADACGVLWLPRSPLQSITSVKYFDASNVEQTLSAALYQAVGGLAPRLVPVWGQGWPATYPRLHAVTVRAVVGYGAPEAVPQELKQWMLLHIGHWFEHREAVTARPMSALPFVDGLLDAERIVVVG